MLATEDSDGQSQTLAELLFTIRSELPDSLFRTALHGNLAQDLPL
jgi:hypothetical protein